jgi:hypothetical protein
MRVTKLNDYWEYQDYYFELAHALHRNPIPPLYLEGITLLGEVNHDY